MGPQQADIWSITSSTTWLWAFYVFLCPCVVDLGRAIIWHTAYLLHGLGHLASKWDYIQTITLPYYWLRYFTVFQDTLLYCQLCNSLDKDLLSCTIMHGSFFCSICFYHISYHIIQIINFYTWRLSSTLTRIWGIMLRTSGRLKIIHITIYIPMSSHACLDHWAKMWHLVVRKRK